MKDSVLRSFALVDNEQLKASKRQEWPAVLHNLFFLHGVVRLRARFAFAGWNRPESLAMTGEDELMDAMRLVMEEFQDTLTSVGADGASIARNTSFQALRYLLTEVRRKSMK